MVAVKPGSTPVLQAIPSRSTQALLLPPVCLEYSALCLPHPENACLTFTCQLLWDVSLALSAGDFSQPPQGSGSAQ